MDEDDYTIYREENLFAEALENLKEIRKSGRLCDIQLKVRNLFFFYRLFFFSSFSTDTLNTSYH